MYLYVECDDLYQKIAQKLKSQFVFSLHSISINTVLPIDRCWVGAAGREPACLSYQTNIAAFVQF